MLFLDKFKGIVFDLDGVLVDTEYNHWQGWVKALKPFGVNFSREEYTDCSGKSGDVIERILIKKYKLPKFHLEKEKESIMAKFFSENKINTMYFVKEAIEFFKTRKFRIAVATSSPKDQAMIKLQNTGLFDFFDSITSRNDVKNGKPYPDIYIFAAKKLGIKPEQCIAFEDTQYGVESAKTAGLYCIAIPTEISVKQDFSKADRIFKNLKEATNYLVNEEI
ncbi:MAG: HAD family phosphatase [Candidatus Aenigmarchaeota archaeon]|nr:HAD family phosphatase [Candidatus Aenigmarchaeota archaeon]